MKVYTEGHDFSFGLEELLRAFFKGEEDGGDLKLFSSYDEGNNLLKTSIYLGGELLGERESNFRGGEGKNSLGHFVKLEAYKILEEKLHPLPWGSLTGVRPLNLLHDKIRDTRDDKECLSYYMETFGVSEEKALLAVRTARLQEGIIEKTDRTYFSLYINIPFCPSKCSYCSFPTAVVKKNDPKMDGYVDLLIREMKGLYPSLKDRKLHTIYIGGGTPSALALGELERLLISIREIFSLEYLDEMTVEVGRPDSISFDLLAMLKDQGVTRISINPQTMNDKTLDKIGRKHDSKMVYQAFYEARKVGGFTINLDLILGLPGEGEEELKNTLKKVLDLDPENLTVHTLALKKGSKFEQENRSLFKEGEDRIEEMGNLTRRFSEGHAYFPYYLYRQKNILGGYENIGYSKEGRINLYNILMMEEVENIIGIGMGASSKLLFEGGERKTFMNHKNLRDYEKKLDLLIDKKRVLLDRQGVKGEKDT